MLKETVVYCKYPSMRYSLKWTQSSLLYDLEVSNKREHGVSLVCIAKKSINE